MNKQKGSIDIFIFGIILVFIVAVGFIIYASAKNAAKEELLANREGESFAKEVFVAKTKDNCEIFRLPDLNGYVYRIKCDNKSSITSVNTQGKTTISTTTVEEAK